MKEKSKKYNGKYQKEMNDLQINSQRNIKNILITHQIKMGNMITISQYQNKMIENEQKFINDMNNLQYIHQNEINNMYHYNY